MEKEKSIKRTRVLLGKFNVHIKIHYIDLSIEELDVVSWNHVGDYLALDQLSGMTVICLENVFKFELTPQEAKIEVVT